MEVNFFETIDDEKLFYAVIIATYNNKLVFCQHKQRTTLEIPGGHRENNEAIIETAKRELYEETGAIKFNLTPICVYQATKYGMLYFAEIFEFENELHYEIEKIVFLDKLPTNFTYFEIQPKLIKEAIRRGFLPKELERL